MTDWLPVIFAMATGFVGLTVALGLILWNLIPQQASYENWRSSYPLRRPSTYRDKAQVKPVPVLKRVPINVRRIR